MKIRHITPDGATEHGVDDLPGLLTRTDGFVWVDIAECDSAAVKVLSGVFKFHRMAVQDCAERNRVPKMHAYADCVFLVLHGPQRGERGHVHFLELDQFIGLNFLVTVHGPLNPAVLSRIETGRLRPAGPAELSHAIVAALTRHQEEYLEHVTAEVWRLEQRVTGGEVEDPEEFLNELFRARHGLLTVRTMSALSSTIYQRVVALPGIADGDQALFADTADRFVRRRTRRSRRSPGPRSSSRRAWSPRCTA
jgi:Mg2+ and Co2+ transporter CorA